ncbi:biotin transporter BioY [Kocuria sp. M1R5S2]|uniref:biotin transporter BioY n=1 Tax=Kocuria rhizosphaerae TaxID=3376285 RepID=UPI0037B9AF90
MTNAERRRTVTAEDYVNIGLFAALTAALSLLPGISLGAVGVPLTLQTLAVFLTGLVLGGTRGLLAVGLYVVLGLIGAPIFADFRGGPDVLADPSAGYILAFPFAAAATGYLAQWLIPARRYNDGGATNARYERTGTYTLRLLLGTLAGFVVIRLGGIPGLVVNGDLTWGDAFLADLTFWPADLLKCVLAAVIAVGVHKAFPRIAGAR